MAVDFTFLSTHGLVKRRTGLDDLHFFRMANDAFSKIECLDRKQMFPPWPPRLTQGVIVAAADNNQGLQLDRPHSDPHRDCRKRTICEPTRSTNHAPLRWLSAGTARYGARARARAGPEAKAIMWASLRERAISGVDKPPQIARILMDPSCGARSECLGLMP